MAEIIILATVVEDPTAETVSNLREMAKAINWMARTINHDSEGSDMMQAILKEYYKYAEKKGICDVVARAILHNNR